MLSYSDFGNLKKVISEYIKPSDNFQNDIKVVLENPEFDKKIGKLTYDIMGNSGIIHKMKFFQDFAKTGSNITIKELLLQFVNFDSNNKSVEIIGGGSDLRVFVVILILIILSNNRIKDYSEYADIVGLLILILLQFRKQGYRKLLIRYVKKILLSYLTYQLMDNNDGYFGGENESEIKKFIDTEIRKSGISLKSPESEIDLFCKMLFSKLLLKIKNDHIFARKVITDSLETGFMVPEHEIRNEIKKINPDLIKNIDFYNYYEDSHDYVYDYVYPKNIFLDRTFQISLVIILVVILLLIIFMQKLGISFKNKNEYSK